MFVKKRWIVLGSIGAALIIVTFILAGRLRSVEQTYPIEVYGFRTENGGYQFVDRDGTLLDVERSEFIELRLLSFLTFLLASIGSVFVFLTVGAITTRLLVHILSKWQSRSKTE